MSGAMDNDMLRDRARRIVGAGSPLGPREVGSSDRLTEDLGYDSLAGIELSLLIEKDFVMAPAEPGEALEIKTVLDVEEFVTKYAVAFRTEAQPANHGRTS